MLYGGAIHEAGAVKARRAARHATSDWMELEKQRGLMFKHILFDDYDACLWENYLWFCLMHGVLPFLSENY